MTRQARCRLALLLLIVVLGCRRDNRSAGTVMKEFLDEFYSGRAQVDMMSVVEEFTEWPDFAAGNVTQIAKDRDIRLVNESDNESNFEVRFKVIAEERNGKVEIGEADVVQTFRLRRRRGQWRILEPIFIPCVSVAGELERLKAAITDASERIEKKDFTEATGRDYFETLISNARASIQLLESHR